VPPREHKSLGKHLPLHESARQPAGYATGREVSTSQVAALGSRGRQQTTYLASRTAGRCLAGVAPAAALVALGFADDDGGGL